ncbi:hypothetical protein BFW38_09180 [Terasakiispira papahanaumokuakeensis]|uniref:DNA-binding protein H-NS-like N-terminal domain-containing protein n=1 Tax=Terasakiispira papahanaumokuakeensis TaxID=197479 RepID=A0A1E2V9J4_9GAMM|nr:hypothetical protein [Terasakiispira papahanaumokuakeensis]ODC03689.1 hypothetical protein BFW38_09180 [Terasakiispira papahanaumokuakeensis]
MSQTDSLDEVYAVFGNKNRLKAVLRRLTLDELEKARDAMTLVLDERMEEEKQREEEELKRREKLAELTKMMEKEGIAAEDLVEALGQKKRRGRPPKKGN